MTWRTCAFSGCQESSIRWRWRVSSSEAGHQSSSSGIAVKVDSEESPEDASPEDDHEPDVPVPAEQWLKENASPDDKHKVKQGGSKDTTTIVKSNPGTARDGEEDQLRPGEETDLIRRWPYHYGSYACNSRLRPLPTGQKPGGTGKGGKNGKGKVYSYYTQFTEDNGPSLVDATTGSAVPQGLEVFVNK